MSFFSTNISILKQNSNDLVTSVQKAKKEVLRPIQCSSGDMSAEYKGILLHSSHSPWREAERIALKTLTDCKESDAILCFGFGLAYHIEALLQQNTVLPIIVIEADIDIFASALCIRDFSSLLQQKQLYIFAGKNEQDLIRYLESLGINFPHLITIQSLLGLYDPAVFAAMRNAVDKFRERNELNRNTLERFGPRWIRNTVRNLPLLADSCGIEEISLLFQNNPCLICAAGPTLDENWDLLHLCHQRMPILAVDTACSLLRKMDIEPDFLLVMEPQYWNSRHLDSGCMDNTILISDSAAYPRVFRLCKNAPLIFGASFFPLGQFFDPPGRKKIAAGGSVASSAWDVARLLGANEIYLAGLDLSFPGLKTHARGAFAERLFQIKETRLNRTEGNYMKYMYSAQSFWTKNTAGEPVLSDKRMKLYQWWFESQFHTHNQISNYLLSENGLALEKTSLANKRYIEELPVRREEIDSILQNLRKALQNRKLNSTKKQHAHIEALKNNLRGLLRELAAVADEAAAISNTLQQRSSPKLLQKLEDLESKILVLSTGEIVGFLMQRSIRTILQQREKEHAYANSHTLHVSLSESAGKLLALLEK